MNFSATEVFGFSDSLMEFIRNSYDEFSDLGINVGAWLTELEEKKQNAEYITGEQEKMKAVMNDLTARTQQSVSTLYDISSTRLDAVIGVVGKKTELGKQAVKIRNKVRAQIKKMERNAV